MDPVPQFGKTLTYWGSGLFSEFVKAKKSYPIEPWGQAQLPNAQIPHSVQRRLSKKYRSRKSTLKGF